MWPALLLLFTLPHAELRQYEREAFERINEFRLRSGVQVLLWDETLASAARQESEDLARLNFFSHINPERGPVGTRLSAIGVSWTRCGENIFRERGHPEPAVLAAISWWFSEGHRKNLLTPEYARSAVGFAEAANGDLVATQIFIGMSR